MCTIQRGAVLQALPIKSVLVTFLGSIGYLEGKNRRRASGAQAVQPLNTGWWRCCRSRHAPQNPLQG